MIETNTPEVTANTLSSNTVSVTMTDPQAWNYPTSDLTVSVDGQPCTITGGTFTSFTCTLPTNGDGSPVLTAGDWFVKVLVRNMGQVPIASGASAMTYSLSLTSSSPSSGGSNGGYSAVISGNGFPSDKSEVSITVCSGKIVEIVSITNTEITVTVPSCPTEALDSFSVTYDGQTLTTAFTYTSSGMTASITSVSPSSASPVLKQIMTIAGSGFGTDESVVSVRLADYANSKFYPMKILSISDT